MRALSPFVLERYFARYEFSARRLLSSSDCEALTLTELLEHADSDMRALWDAQRLGYGESRGHPLLREAIAGLHVGIGPEDVVCAAPQEGVLLAMHALVEPGDRVVVPKPAYQSLYEIARSLGAEIVPWRPIEEEGYRFRVEDLAAALRTRPKLVVFNFPHNPTGWLPNAHEHAAMIAAVAASGAWIFSDEMYRFLEHAPEDALPSVVDVHARSVVLGGLSKAFGLAGLRSGWLVSRDAALLERIAVLKDYTTICGSGPSEILATIALRAKKRLVTRVREIVLSNLEAIDRFVAAHPGVFAWQRPRAGSVGLARLGIGEPASVFADRLVRETGIMLLPSTVFDDGDAHVRLGFGRRDLPDGLAELATYLEGRTFTGTCL